MICQRAKSWVHSERLNE